MDAIKVITTTYHLKMKFPTKVGIGKVCGEQVLSKECYLQELCQGEKDVKMTEPLMEEDREKAKDCTNLVPPPPPEERLLEVEMRDENALIQGENDEPLEIITLNPKNSEATVKD